MNDLLIHYWTHDVGTTGIVLECFCMFVERRKIYQFV